MDTATDNAPKSVYYKGRKYTRQPQSDKWSERMYYRLGGGKGYLHRDIYRDHHGDIPDRYHVHHIDHNPFNNDPSNLTLISPEDHMSHHSGERWGDLVHRARGLEHLDEVRHLASEWHRSEEGHQWHVEHGRRVFQNLPPKRFTCDQCGAGFEARGMGRNRFCSNACRSAWRRASGLDDVDRVCAACGATFRTNKYGKVRTCSRSCGSSLRRDRGPARV